MRIVSEYSAFLGGKPFCVVDDSDGVPKIIAQFDDKSEAMICAAAPNMLAALERLLDSPCCNEDEQEDETAAAITACHTAIAKAKGGAA